MLSAAVENAANEQALFTLGAMLILARRWYQRCFSITALGVPNSHRTRPAPEPLFTRSATCAFYAAKVYNPKI